MSRQDEDSLFLWHVLVLDDFTRTSTPSETPAVGASVPTDPEVVVNLVSSIESWACVRALGESIEALPSELVPETVEQVDRAPLFPWDLILVDMEWRTLPDPAPKTSLRWKLFHANPDWDDTRLGKEVEVLRDSLIHGSLSLLDARNLNPPGPDSQASDQRTAIHNWLTALSFACHAPADKIEKHCRWLSVNLKPPEVGPWIAAMMSYVCPEAEMLLYSQSADEVMRRQSVAPWVNFAPTRRPLDVAQKSAVRGISPTKLAHKLERRQIAVLRDNQHLWAWAQRQWMRFVLGDSSLGSDTDDDVAAMVRHRTDGNRADVKLRADLFFPQILFSKNDPTCREEMERSLRRVVAGVCRRDIFSWSFQSRVEAAVHALVHVRKSRDWPMDVLEGAVRCIGAEGLPALQIVDALRTASGLPFSTTLTEAQCSTADASLEQILHFLLCLQDGSTYMMASINEAQMPTLASFIASYESRGSQTVGFPMVQTDWDSLLVHLRDDSSDVRVVRSDHTIEVSAYVSGAMSRETITAGILDACKRRGGQAIRRGQPAVALSALHMGASAIRYHVSEGVWDLLSGRVVTKTKEEVRCGVALVFPCSQCEAVDATEV